MKVSEKEAVVALFEGIQKAQSRIAKKWPPHPEPESDDEIEATLVWWDLESAVAKCFSNQDDYDKYKATP